MGNHADANQMDPYGEFGHVTLTSLVEAARLYREAIKTPRKAGDVQVRIKLINEAEYRLKHAAFFGDTI